MMTNIEYCQHCNGYGSSLRDDATACRHCHGTGEASEDFMRLIKMGFTADTISDDVGDPCIAWVWAPKGDVEISARIVDGKWLVTLGLDGRAQQLAGNDVQLLGAVLAYRAMREEE